MPRRVLLTEVERAGLLAFPTDEADWIRHYSLSEPDLSMVRQRRGDHNRLGFAIQLCYLRYPGFAMPPEARPPAPLLSLVAQQTQTDPELWSKYAQRSATRREHLLELQSWLGLTTFAIPHVRKCVAQIIELAMQTDRGVVLANALLDVLRRQRIMIPSVDVLERMCAAALTRGTRRVYEALTTPLSSHQKQLLDGLLAVREGSKFSSLAWLRQPPGFPNPKHVLAHIERLKAFRALGLPEDLERAVHQNRLLKLAREGGQMTSQHLRDLEPLRRYATLCAVVLDTRATLIDEIIDMHDRILGALFTRAKKSHVERFHQSGKAINAKLRLYSRIGRALLDAKQSGGDPFAAIETVLSWESFAESVEETEKLAQPADFDFLPLIGDGFTQLRRYTPAFLEALTLKAAPAAKDILAGVDTLKGMNQHQERKVPDGAPISFIRKRWVSIIQTEDGLDRRFYELCVLSELKNALRSGDIWVQGSRQFKDFEEYLLPPSRYKVQRDRQELGLAVDTDCERFLEERLALLKRELDKVEKLAAKNELPDVSITSSGLKLPHLQKQYPTRRKP